MFHGNIDYHTALGLKELRTRISKGKIPSSKLDKSINVATWNIREFGKSKRRADSLHFIAEILGQFDLIAVTELRKNLSELKKVLDILGPYWKVVFSDYTLDRGGNGERMAYIYDKRAVVFTGLAAEADPPRKKNKKTGEYEALLTWWRPPFIASFSAGNFDFMLLTVHIRWGNKLSERKTALELLAKWVDKKRKDAYSVDKDIIVMGDFNIPELDDSLFQAITSKGLRIPESLRGIDHGSNLAMNKRYDQIFYYPHFTKSFTNHGGILDFHSGGIDKLYPKNTPDFNSYTFEMSDHLPLWVQLNINVEDEKLEQIIQDKKPK
ncbi:endonuclease/exonuclease/phosphatase family protein [Bacteroidota bacterium]